MTSKIIKYAVWAGMLASAFSVSRLVPSMGAQQSATSAVDALQKARVLDRLAAAMPTEHKGTAPGFVLDPAWPQPLPHHWVIGDVGGIAVDKHDHIWVYHRPRSVSSTDSGMQGVAGTDAKGKPISVLGSRGLMGSLTAAVCQRRRTDPEIQNGWHVRLSDRHCRREGAEQQRYQRRRQRDA